MNKEEQDWLDYIEKHRNSPREVFQKATTEWEKLAAVEFFLNKEEHGIMNVKLSHVEKAVYALLTLASIPIASFFIEKIIAYLSTL